MEVNYSADRGFLFSRSGFYSFLKGFLFFNGGTLFFRTGFYFSCGGVLFFNRGSLFFNGGFLFSCTETLFFSEGTSLAGKAFLSNTPHTRSRTLANRPYPTLKPKFAKELALLTAHRAANSNG